MYERNCREHNHAITRSTQQRYFAFCHCGRLFAAFDPFYYDQVISLLRLLRSGWYDQWQWDGTVIILSCRRLRGRTLLHTSCTFSRLISWEGSVAIYLADTQVLSCKNLCKDRHFTFSRKCRVASALQTCRDISPTHFGKTFELPSSQNAVSPRNFSASLVCFYVQKPVVLSLQSSYRQGTFSRAATELKK